MANKESFNAHYEYVSTLLKQKIYDVKDTGETARNIHHWKKEGLLLNNDILDIASKNKKLLLNLTEFFWIKTIQQCRLYGLSIQDIKKVKKDVEQFVQINYTEENKKIALKVVTQKINEDFPDESEDFKRGVITEITKRSERENKPNSGIESIVEAILRNRRQSGLFIVKDSVGISTVVYIKVDGITDAIPELLMTTTHFYISFDEIFFNLGIDNHFKHSGILTEEERRTIIEYSEFLNSNAVKSVTSINKKGVTETKVELRHINDPKEIENYKVKYGDDFTWRSKSHNGKTNFFDFRIDRKHGKI